MNQGFIVHRESEGKPNMIFKKHPCGLHYYDPSDQDFTFINTVDENMKSYSKRQIQRAQVAKALFAKLSYPSWRDFKWIVRTNMIKDCPVLVADIDAAAHIWGKDVVALKGKTAKKKPTPVTWCETSSRSQRNS